MTIEKAISRYLGERPDGSGPSLPTNAAVGGIVGNDDARPFEQFFEERPVAQRQELSAE
jgi:hypothetical protein